MRKEGEDKDNKEKMWVRKREEDERYGERKRKEGETATVAGREDRWEER